MTTTTKRADELKVGDIIKPRCASLWRIILQTPRHEDHSAFLWCRGDFVQTDGRMAGGGNKNEFYPQDTVMLLFPNEIVEVMIL